MTAISQEAVNLFIADKKHQRTLQAITLLTSGVRVADAAKQLGVSRVAINDVRRKYIDNK